MKYIDYAPGGPEFLRIAEGQVPDVGAGEVLVHVAAAGVNRPDILQRQGLYPAPAAASPVLGLEVAGDVIALGQGVKRWRLGDRVCALVNGGGYATHVAVPEAQCLPVPQGLDWVQAAALPETLFTVWHNLIQRAHLQAGERLLVHGGASGIGTMAIQLAKALGADVFATAGSVEKCAACAQLGAQAINYRIQDFVGEVKALTAGQGVDVILDMVGGDYVQRNFSAAAKDGRIVNIAFLQGSRVTLDLMPFMLKRLTFTGSTLRAQSAAAKAQIARELEAQVWPLLAAGKIRPMIDSVYPLARVADAHRRMEANQHIGKLVLDMNL
ncbi:NAD(P)H-quinone oxidoreductase [Cellvibrio japonicus]|uniref:Alcohol dehydrogenase, zinc-containing n=1 Tax=Cellvibrio japonicus (strain Ueda107) TaxID=498211 RepID=B3PCX9_CELJU|nr:NAD(P)H-quinone oxidoreductase [Cellvibrio japonicus]ACE83248.1 alcohol dehydrogenase, zinc-containing [Cellvibrio japonicus Ueda107]QEI11923.1 NAD(P)H-quinone oxidoreductase [Cellvibrio japonicus]QEI15497.1 NAD(P)H-quinone oxidoreductase [Cellvibrio japonicus]QEI19076.1 NAD(P)H-quinone oxidoreductase [Cellvibrio japonicus]